MSAQTFVLPIGDRERMADRVLAFLLHALPGKRLRVRVEADKKDRTIPQLRYLNGVAYKLLSDATGYERDDISEFCCGTYFGWRTVKCPVTPSNPQGCKDVPLRTTTRDENGNRDVIKWDAFCDYVAWIQRFAASKGVFIPDPEGS